MKKPLLIIATVLILAGAGYGVYDLVFMRSASSPAVEPAPPLTQSYKNSAYNFSLMMPAGYAASESQDPSTGADTIVLQNKTGDGIQIIISPFDEDKPPYSGYTLTEARILQDLPNLAISDQQPVNVGSDYIGLAFLSDNQAFDGASREVWFVFRGNLYQISTYARLDPLLQAIFKTWQFN